MEQLVYLRMTGRCANGFERDGGRKVHAVSLAGLPPGCMPGWQKAICGASPGRKGNGWSEYKQQALTCPRCLKKVERATLAAYHGDIDGDFSY